jgi:hypothetical protein
MQSVFVTDVKTFADLAAILAAIVALASCVVAVHYSHETKLDSDFATAMNWRRDFREWASLTIVALVEAKEGCSWAAAGEKDNQALATFRTRLWIQTEQGRLFLPNQPGKADVGEILAYRGYRHAVLDPVVAAHYVLRGRQHAFASAPDALEHLQKLFVSRVQAILDPAHVNAQVARMIRDSARSKVDQTNTAGLDPDLSDIPSGARALLASGKSIVE